MMVVGAEERWLGLGCGRQEARGETTGQLNFIELAVAMMHFISNNDLMMLLKTTLQ